MQPAVQVPCVNVIPVPEHCGELLLIASGDEGNEFTVIDEVVLLHPVDVSVNVNVGKPADIPVTTPPLVTVADSLLLVHVPLDVGDKVVVPSTQIDRVPIILTVGDMVTVTVVVYTSVAEPQLLLAIKV